MRRVWIVAVLAAMGVNASAFSLFNFESSAATTTFPNHPGALNTLSMTDAGLTLTLSREGNKSFDVMDISSFPSGVDFPLQWHNHALDPFADTGNSWFIGNFSDSVRAVEIEMGDFAGDNDTLVMEVWSGANATGTLLATVTTAWGGQSLPSWGATGWNGGPTASALSVRFTGGSSDFQNSVYYDNIAALRSPVPEPATLAVVGMGIAAVVRRRARKN